MTAENVSIPMAALHWLLGMGEDFERPKGARGAFWWRSEFLRRAGIEWPDKRAPSPAAARVDGFDPGPLVEAACVAFLDAMKPDRIQGFQYGDELVIRDVWKPSDEQVIWRGPADPRQEGKQFSTGPLHDAFQRRCEIEKVRVGISAALATRDAAASERITELEGVLQRYVSWADAKCPCENETSNPCPLCGASVENLEPCKAADNTLPRRLLQDTRTALGDRRDA